MQNVFIRGCGMTRFGPSEISLEEMMYQAAIQALKEAGLETVDGVIVGAMNPEMFAGESNVSAYITDYLGLVPTPTLRIETASSTGAATFDGAFFAVSSGYFKNILVVCGEKMTSLKTSIATRVLSEVLADDERKQGATMPAMAALVTRAYMHRYKCDRRAFTAIAIKNHKNGAKNPYAHFQYEIDEERVETSKMISDPLRLYDCSPMSDGACAVVLSSQPGPVKVTGIGHGTDHIYLASRKDICSFNSTQVAAQKAYKMARLSPKDIDVAEIHDAFTPFEVLGCEDVGFYEPGKSWRHILDGETEIGAKRPVNPGGGLKARGHPVGASGLAQIIEIVWQFTGRAGARQVQNRLRYGLTQSVGGLGTSNIVTLLENVA